MSRMDQSSKPDRQDLSWDVGTRKDRPSEINDDVLLG